MNYQALTFAALMSIGTVAVAQEPDATPVAKASAVVEPPSDAVLIQLQDGGKVAALQARYRTVSNGQPDLRGVAQSFAWSGDKPLDRIGIKLSPEQGSVDPFDLPQDYILEVHRVDADAREVPSIGKVLEALVTITPESLSGDFLDIDLDKPAELEDGVAYLFHLRPAAEQENAGVQRIYFARSDESADPYGGGVANQTDGQPREAEGTFGRRNYDLLFYLVASE